MSDKDTFSSIGSVTFKVGYVEDWKDKQHGEGRERISQSAINHPQSTTDQKKLRFQVEDTGIGIPSDKLTEIFLPFQQAVKGQFARKGTGLGLAISQNIVQQMGGEIQVESTLGQGSIFWFEVNLSEIESSHQVRQTDTKRKICGFRGQAPPILIVDDKNYNRAILIKFLSSLGFEVVEATNGEEGLVQAQRYQPGLILVDLVMPVLDGFETSRRLRKEPKFQEVSIIATSASILPQEQILSEQAGCNAFLPKPIDLDRLLELLEVHLNLDWIYEPISSPTLIPKKVIQQNLEEDSTSSLLVAPPDEELALLLELAKQGNIARILERAANIERLGSQYLPFTQKLSQLAQSFQEKKLRQFIEEKMRANE